MRIQTKPNEKDQQLKDQGKKKKKKKSRPTYSWVFTNNHRKERRGRLEKIGDFKTKKKERTNPYQSSNKN